MDTYIQAVYTHGWQGSQVHMFTHFLTSTKPTPVYNEAQSLALRA